MPLTPTELARYSRHFSLPQVGQEGQLRLKNAKVLCVGAGGLGSPLLLYLAAAGIGTLGIIDNDEVEISNLQRQILYKESDISHKKINAAKQHLKALNSDIHIITHDCQIKSDNALTLIQNYDIVVDGSDNFNTRYVVNDACFYLQKPLVYGSILQFEGQCSVFLPNGPCYRCLFPAPPPSGIMPNCAEGGVFGVLPGLIGCLQATEVIKLIIGIGKLLIKRLLQIDALSLNFKDFYYEQNPQCVLCIAKTPFDQLDFHDAESICSVNDAKESYEISVRSLKNLLDSSSDLILLDVREPFEHDICKLSDSLISLQELDKHLDKLDSSKTIIVYCKSGNRGRKAAEILRKKGFSRTYNLSGGIMAWRQEIDPTLQKY